MHPEADALLDAIFDHPDDDTPRLVYADWLQEHGHEDYAQFIRLSIQLERATSPDEWKQCNSKRRPFWKRMVAVRHDAYHHIPIVQNGYERGFCNTVTVHGDTFLRTVESWWPAITPRELTVFGLRGFGTRGIEMEIIAAIGRHLPQLRLLRCQSRPGRHAHESVFPPLSGSVFASLAKPDILPRLSSLHVGVARVDAPALRAFAGSELATRLASMDVELTSTEMEADGVITVVPVHENREPQAVRLAIEEFLEQNE